MAKKKKEHKSKLLKYLNRFLLLVVISLISLIVLKSSSSLQEKVYKTVFQNNFSFAKINEVYEKYFGSSLPFVKEESEQLVSAISLEYQEDEKYKDGVKLTVENDYLIPATSSGLIIFAGEKEGYGNTIVLQRPDGIEVWYSNLDTTSVSLYDYVKSGTTIGVAKDNTLYMVFTEDGEYLDYKDYI